MLTISEGDNAPDEIIKVKFKMNLDVKKAEKLLHSYFHSIQSGSIGYSEQKNIILIYDQTGKIFTLASLKKEFPSMVPIFTNAVGGFIKELKNTENNIVGNIIDTDTSSNLWLALTKECHVNRPGIPILLFADVPEKLSFLNKDELSIVDIIPRPKDYGQLIKKMSSLVTSNNEEMQFDDEINHGNISHHSDDYIEVPTSGFTLGAKSPFDIFVKINDKKFVQILSKNQSFDKEQVQRHIAKGVEKYYILTENYRDFMVKFNNEVNHLCCDPNSDLSLQKTRFLDFGKEVYSFLTEKNIPEESLAYAENFVQKSGEFIAKMAKNGSLISDFLFDIEAQEHAVSVCILTGIFLKKIEASETIFNEIGIASFLHDIGLLGTPDAVKREDIEEMSLEEVDLYLAHPKKGADLLEKLKFKPTICEAVFQHHMRLNKGGFPEMPKGKANKINHIAELIGLTEELLLLLKKAKIDPSINPIEDLRKNLSRDFSNPVVKAYQQAFPKTN
jgi:hypothetical protein